MVLSYVIINVTNNFVECFNAKIGELRCKPICKKKKKKAQKWITHICPKVKRIYGWSWADGYFCKTVSAGNGQYEIKDESTYFNVDLQRFTCDCQV